MNALRIFAVWVVLVLLLLALFTWFAGPVKRSPPSEISYSQLLNDIDQGRVRDVVIQGHEIRGTYNDRSNFQTHMPDDSGLIERLNKHNVRTTDKNVPWFVSLLPWLAIIAFGGVLTFVTGRNPRNFVLWAAIVLSLIALFTLL